MKRLSFAVLLTVMMFATLACAPGLMSIHVDMPTAKSPKAFTHSVVIKRVTDQREFGPWQTSPRQQSWGSAIEAMHTPQFKSQAVARNAEVGRRDFGGNVLLEGNQTVMSMVTNATSEGFRRAGYDVLTTPTPPEGTPVVTIDIDKLWGWFEYQSLNSTVGSELVTRVTISYANGSSNTITVKTSVKNSALHYSQANWKKSFDSLMTAYADGLAKELAKPENQNGT